MDKAEKEVDKEVDEKQIEAKATKITNIIRKRFSRIGTGGKLGFVFSQMN